MNDPLALANLGDLSDAEAEAAIKAAAAQAMQERDLKDKANQRDRGRPKKIADGQGNGISSSRPVGNSVEAALRRLRKARPDLHALVLSGEITAHAAMVEAGFRKPRPCKTSALDALKRHWQRATPEERAAFLRQAVVSSRR